MNIFRSFPTKAVLIAFVLVFHFLNAKADTTHTIQISSQQQFDALSDNICQSIAQGYKSIVVNVKSGKVLYFHDRHLNLYNIKENGVSVTINGNGTCICAAGNDYVRDKKGRANYNGDIAPKSCFVSNNSAKEVLTHNDFQFANNTVEVIDPKKKLCRIYTGYKGTANGMVIQITASYKSYFCPVTSVVKGYVYFIDSQLEYRNASGGYYSINHDFVCGKVNPRYRLFNAVSSKSLYNRNGKIYIPKGVNAVHECLASQFLRLTDCTLNRLQITGFVFSGSNGNESLFYINGTKASALDISNCTFRYIKGNILDFHTSNNLHFHNNNASHCWQDAIFADNDSKNVEIDNNTFSNMGEQMLQQHVIFCQCEDYNIHNNKISDFSYCAIRVGMHYSSKMNNPCNGVIAENELFYSNDYFRNFSKYTLMDSGAIYVATQNTKVDVRDNNVHDYIGMAENRGIYLDDGAMNVSVYKNIVKNVPNSYTIDAWRASGVDSYIADCNNHNKIYCNLLYGPYRFQGRASSDCQSSCNFIVNTSNSKKSTVENVKKVSKDIDVSETAITGSDESMLKSLIKTHYKE